MAENAEMAENTEWYFHCRTRFLGLHHALRPACPSLSYVLPAVLALLGCSYSWANAESPKLRSVRIMPQSIELWGADASQTFIVLGKYSDGLERDITSEGRVRSLAPEVARINSPRR